MRRVFLWAARNSWLKAHLPRPLVHAAGRAAVHARRDDGRRAQGGDPAPEGRHRHALHPARREPREPGRGGCGRGPLPRADRPDRGRRHPRRDLRQADAAGARPRPGRLPRERPPPGRARGRRRLVPVDRHGGQRLHRGDRSRSTSRSRRSSRRPASACRRTSSAPPPTSSGCSRSIPAIRLVKGAYDEPAAIAYRDRRGVDANYLGLAVRFLLDGRGKPIRLGPGHARRRADRADRGAGRGRRRRARRLRDRDALRHPRERAAPAGEGRLPGADADRLRRALVPVVHAPSGGAAGERRRSRSARCCRSGR